MWNVTKLKRYSKVSDLTLPPCTQKNELYNHKKCFYYHRVFVLSWSLKPYFLYLPPWLISPFRDLSWLIQDSYCTLGDTTLNTFLKKKFGYIGTYQKDQAKEFLDCVWSLYFSKSSGQITLLPYLFLLAERWQSSGIPLQLSSTVCDQTSFCRLCMCV